MSNHIINKLRDGLDNVKPVTLGELSIGLKVVRQNHYHDAQMVVSSIYQDQGVSVGMHNIDDYEADKLDQYLLMTVVDLQTNEPVFESVEQMRELLHKDLREALIAEAEQWQEDCSPNLDQMPAEEFEQLLEKVKKKPDLTTLKGLNLYTLKKLVHTLANQPKT